MSDSHCGVQSRLLSYWRNRDELLSDRGTVVFVAHFRTADVSAELRFEAWHEITSKALISTVVTRENVNEFAATVSVFDLGAVQISTVAYPSLRVARTARMIRRSDPEVYYLVMPLHGKLSVSHVDREADVCCGQFILIDTSRPGVVANRESVEHLIIAVPRSELPKSSALSAVVARSLPARRGMGSLLLNVAQQLMGSADEYGPADGQRVRAVVVDLVALALAGHLDEDDAVRDAGQRLLQMRILDFIERQLPDPRLSSSIVAAAHNISVRYLQALLQSQGLTVAGWIRERRLDRCRRDLRDSELAARPVYAIGARWGFSDATTFSRTFKQAFGLSPGDYRRQHL